SITCCVAAGNEGKDCYNLAPAQYKECITVAAMDENDEIPEWSNYGKCVDIIAPGVNISSAHWFYLDSYVEMSGTSMATPFVTAAAANVLSKNPNALPQEIKEFLQINGRDINAPEHFYGAPALYLGKIKKFDMYEKPAAPTFSLSDGVYDEGTKLKINKSSGSDIYYQIYDYDKSDNEYKLTSKTKYTGEIILDRPCVIVAVASYKGFLDSDIAQSKFYVKYASDEGRFTIDENGTITSYSGNSSNLVIPEKINGITVKAIGERVFTQRDDKEFVNSDKYSNYLRTVTLPETCTDIDYYAFFGCKYMTDVFGGNIKNVGICAFSKCEELSNIDISEVNTIAGNGLSSTGIKEFVNSSIEKIEHSAFSGCKSLEFVNLPNVEIIGRHAFYYCENLSNISLSNNLLSIGEDAFYECPKLTNIYFNGTKREWENVEFGSRNECLKAANIHFTAYSTDNYTLLSAIDEAKEYSKAEYTKESLESLNALVNRYKELINSGLSQEEYDSATAEILNAIISLDALSNYDISSFNGTEIELTNKNGKTTSLTFADFLNEECESLDVVDDGVVNAKDYAYLIRNY
ncbi:leucine-rich repeat protein, partial [bacterium]|nr:leucine-rich repeat protein [bacterium]